MRSRIAWKQRVFWNCRAGFITRSVMTTTTRRRAFLVVCSSAFRRLKPRPVRRGNAKREANVEQKVTMRTKVERRDSFVSFALVRSSAFRRPFRLKPVVNRARKRLARPEISKMAFTTCVFGQILNFGARPPYFANSRKWSRKAASQGTDNRDRE